MSERPFMQLYVSDFVGDTLLLSTEHIGAYLLLLIALWNAGGALPDDDVKLARVARLTADQWRMVRPELEPFFAVEDGKFTHGRLSKELRKSASKSEARSEAGRRGGIAKALKDNDAGVAIATVLPQHLPETRKEKEKSTISPKKPIDENWSLPGDLLASTQAAYPSVTLASILAEAPRFRDHYLANGAEFADWEPKWRNWCRNAFPGKEVTKAEAAASEAAMAGRVRLHMDSQLFRQIVKARGGKHPPTDREGCWTFPDAEVAAATLAIQEQAA